MPNWKKVITSGSNADLNIISGSNILISETSKTVPNKSSVTEKS